MFLRKSGSAWQGHMKIKKGNCGGEDESPGIRYSMDEEPAFQSGGAGLVSTVDDYGKFGTMLLNGGIFGRACGS